MAIFLRQTHQKKAPKVRKKRTVSAGHGDKVKHQRCVRILYDWLQKALVWGDKFCCVCPTTFSFLSVHAKSYNWNNLERSSL